MCKTNDRKGTRRQTSERENEIEMEHWKAVCLLEVNAKEKVIIPEENF